MSRHVRALSVTITDNIQASAQVITDAGQGAINKSTNAVQRILNRDQVPEWSTYIPENRFSFPMKSSDFVGRFRYTMLTPDFT